MRRTKEDSKKTKETIIEAAYKLFALKGYSNVSLIDIVNQTEYTRGAIYWHFKNKQEIYEYIIRAELNEIRYEIDKIFSESKNLQELIMISLNQIIKNEKYYFVNQAINLKYFHKELTTISNEVENAKILYYSNLSKFLVKEIKAPNKDIEKYIKYIYTIFEGTYQFAIQRVMQTRLSELDVEFFVELIIKAIK